jgi:hypothetical protein
VPRQPLLMRATCACGGSCPRCSGAPAAISGPRLAVNEPGDVFEREADRVADQVMRMPDPGAQAADDPPARSSRGTPSLQRKCACGGGAGGCETCKTENDIKLQRKSAASGGATTAPPVVHAVLRSPGQPLDAATRSFMEPRFSRDFGDVRVHSDSMAAESARAVGARAYAVGSSIAFSNGEYRPGADSGRRLLAHELAHVVQQSHAAPPSMLHDAGGTLRREAQPGAPPIYWGLDVTTEPRRYYVSIPPPGRSLSDVAAFLYGDAAKADGLSAANPGAPDFLSAGAVLRLGAAALAPAAQASLSESLKSGMLLRTTGVPNGASGSLVYKLRMGEQSLDLVGYQYQALLRGLAWHLRIQADYLKDMCEVYLDTRNNHVESSNSLIRGISDWAGDVSVPDEEVYTGPRDRAKAIFDDLGTGEPTEAKIIDASRRVKSVSAEYAAGVRKWSIYINGTIRGAERAETTAKVVAVSCAVIEVGLATVVVAPFVASAASSVATTVATAVPKVALAVSLAAAPVATTTEAAVATSALVETTVAGTAVAAEGTTAAVLTTAAAETAPAALTAAAPAAAPSLLTAAAPAVAPAATQAATSSLASLATATVGVGLSATALSSDTAPSEKEKDKKEEEDKKKKRPCITGPYGSITCPPGEQAHHIVPDYTLRYGNRAEGVRGQKRIPGLPLFNDGPSICLSGHAKVAGDEHSIAHQADLAIAAVGAANQPRGAAQMGKITGISVFYAMQARRDCVVEIAAALAAQPSLFGDTLGRTTLMPPEKWPPS